MFEYFKKRIAKTFMSKKQFAARKVKRTQDVYKKAFDNKLRQYKDEYLDLNRERIKHEKDIPQADRKEIIARAVKAAHDIIAERAAKKIKKINLEPHGFLYNLTYASGVLETNIPGLSSEEQNVKEMSATLHAGNSVRGDIDYFTFYNQFHGDIEAMVFYKTYFNTNSELDIKIWDTLNIDRNSFLPEEQQKKRLLSKDGKFWQAAKEATGYSALFIPGRKSRKNIFRKLEEWFNYQEEALNRKMRSSLELHERPPRSTIIKHLIQKSLLNIAKEVSLFFFLPFLKTGHYIKKDTALFLLFTALAIICIFVPPLTAIPAAIVATLGLGYFTGWLFIAVATLVAFYGTLLWNIVAIKAVDTLSKLFFDIKIILFDKHFWLWEFGRFLFSKNSPPIEAQLDKLEKGKGGLELASSALQSVEARAVRAAITPVAQKQFAVPENHLSKSAVLLKDKYVLEFKTTSVIVHPPQMLKRMSKELTFSRENQTELLYLYNFIRVNHNFVHKKHDALLGKCIRGFITTVELETLVQEIPLPTKGPKNIPILNFLPENLIEDVDISHTETLGNVDADHSDRESTESDGAGIGVADEIPVNVNGAVEGTNGDTDPSVSEEIADDAILFSLMFDALSEDERGDNANIILLEQLAIRLSKKTPVSSVDDDVSSELSDDDDDDDDEKNQGLAQEVAQAAAGTSINSSGPVVELPQALPLVSTSTFSSSASTLVPVITSGAARRPSLFPSASRRGRFQEAKEKAEKHSVEGLSSAHPRDKRAPTLTAGDVSNLRTIYSNKN